MGRKRQTTEEVVSKLPQAEVELAKRSTIAWICKVLGITSQTCFRQRQEHGGLKVDQAKRFKELDQFDAFRPSSEERVVGCCFVST